MNANELAEQLDEYVGNNGYSHNDYADSMSQASTMLRQQQAEIEELKNNTDQLGKVLNEISNKNEALEKELETCKTIVALSNIAWERKHGKD